MGHRGEGGDPPALQGLPVPRCVLPWPLKTQPTPSPFFFPFNLQVSTSCWSPWLPVVLLHVLLLFVSGRLNPGAVSQATGRVPRGPASLGRQRWAAVRMSMAVAACVEEEGRVVFFLWPRWESSSALLCTLCRLWNGCHTPSSQEGRCWGGGPELSHNCQGLSSHEREKWGGGVSREPRLEGQIPTHVHARSYLLLVGCW